MGGGGNEESTVRSSTGGMNLFVLGAYSQTLFFHCVTLKIYLRFQTRRWQLSLLTA
jgi:hypothetical protein